MDKHTPGPFAVLDRRKAVLRNIVIVAGSEPIAEMSRVMQTPTYGPAFDWEDVRRTDEQALLDAKLFAAAPDLLASLRELYGELEDRDTGPAQRAMMALVKAGAR